jgi:hypothetical protein
MFVDVTFDEVSYLKTLREVEQLKWGNDAKFSLPQAQKRGWGPSNPRRSRHVEISRGKRAIADLS